MNHFTHPRFWACYTALPLEIRELADKNFALLKDNPRHPSLQLNRIGALWSARVGSDYRALALDDSRGFVWFWIGSHAEYDQILARR